MAGNFWASSQRDVWLLETASEADLGVGDSLDATVATLLGIYFPQKIQELGKRLHLPQVVIATAIVYFKRFYTRHTLETVSPFTMLAAAVFVACKVDECPQKLASLVKQVTEILKSSFPRVTVTAEDVATTEISLLATLEYSLVVFHPYTALKDYVADAGLADELLETAWYIVNDSYCTAVFLYFPPYLIALAAIYMAGAINRAESSNSISVAEWFGSMMVDMAEVHTVAAHLVTLYDTWSLPTYDADLQRAKQRIDAIYRVP
ncbi:cyclin-C [Thecamonas trahens ATCC 50062]|uniref:Cyclin-C n=1 Tax=Thecamonas trahens ATCC 50062 TaxID=461836 RepID=A0A0L0DKT1_THETB|nr:cyclin-C [Thecamonas trahens ATCC 50062]KNC51963.1 cyclin-C [Thecamonas trahens ATCC 50062]|eukprot:XP_013755550.1 cyclin-C [Thecamonas trahens ATCC 50062]